MVLRVRHPRSAVAGAVALTLPWLAVRALGVSLGPAVTVAVSGVAVLGAAFLLTWGAETAEKDVPREFAIAVLAIIAVAPEYAVDALYAWEAGVAPGSPASLRAADLAVANMTGANRILIGLGWSGIALFAIYRGTEAVEQRAGFLADTLVLDRDLSLEIVFLFAATAYAVFVPFGGIDAVDAVVLVGLYATYVAILLRSEGGEHPTAGVPAYLQSFPTVPRRVAILALFAFSAAVILLAVKPFAYGLEALGLAVGIDPFLMIQWVAPLASESPEFIACLYLVNKARSSSAFNALVSSKLNQWTLLIGTLVVVYTISLGYYDALRFSRRQMGEVWLTAAQSLFAVSLLTNLKMSGREALALLALFLAQFHPVFRTYEGLLAYSVLYLVLAAALLVKRRHHLPGLVASARERL
ncbi:sodium:calcium antiporter [Halospeciosus flavus]|uniref:Sodium:calcium antiporter n=1 Tax=Halospeciosus flavus TaxID=3032283 RepID=A0ABD5Z7Z9_9EURY|nr:sodium:calcium antiporter [Halospeciosus flavus]